MNDKDTTTPKLVFRKPRAEDGPRVHELIEQCKPLDTNSLYCNLLQCSHFADTCVAVEVDAALKAFVSGYILPARQDTFFVWQVAVHESTRGLGLAKRMLLELLRRNECRAVRFLETTITPGNEASWALFRSLARSVNAELGESVLFDRDKHFGGSHASEMLVRIGPISLDIHKTGRNYGNV